MPNEVLNHLRARWEYFRRVVARKEVDDGLKDLKQQGHSGQGIEDLLVCDNSRATPLSSDRLNVVSWNIATGDKFDEILKYLRDLDSQIEGGIDVFALQEVGVNCPLKKGKSYRDVYRDLCNGLKCSGVYGTAMVFLDKEMNPFLHEGKLQHIGEAVLTKYPLDFKKSKLIRFSAVYNWRYHNVPSSGNFINSKKAGGRVAVTASIEMGKEFLVSSVHLEDKTFHWERARQVRQLLSELQDEDQIVAGDFNTFGGRFGPIDKVFFKNGFQRANKLTYTTKNLPFRLDNIYWKSGSLDLKKVTVDKSVKCSDHYPVIVQFKKF